MKRLSVVVVLLAATILATTGVVLTLRDAGRATRERARDSAERVWRRLQAVLTLRATWLGIAFAALSGAGMEAAGALAGPLMIDSGLSKEAAGRFFALPAVAAMAAGALLGGRLADHGRRSSAAQAAVVAVAFAVAALAWASARGFTPALLAALTGVYLLFGVLTAATYALLMDITDPVLGGTQFSTYMAAVNLCYVWSAWAGGRIAGAQGYATALAALAMVSLVSLAPARAIGRASREPAQPSR